MEDHTPTRLVRYTTTLAWRLGVTRRTINRWMKLPGAPQKINGRWDVWDWIDFITAQGLYSGQMDRCCVALNVAGLINDRLPERVTRLTERILMELIEHLLPYDRNTRREFHSSALNTGSQAAERPRAMRIEEINPWNLQATR